jgi:putative nucleotidyltransferase with HDIG domain
MPKNAVRRKPTTSNSRNHTGRLNGREETFLHVSREGALRFLVFAAFAVVLAVLISPTVTLPFNLPTEKDYGTAEKRGVTRRLILAEMEFTTIDLAQTQIDQLEAAGKVPPVYSFDRDALSNAILEVGSFLEDLDEVRQMQMLTFDEKLDLLRNVKNVVPDKISEDMARIWLKSAPAQEAVPVESADAEAQTDQQGEIPEASGTTSDAGVGDNTFDELSQSVKALLQEVLEEGVISEEEFRKVVDASPEDPLVEEKGLVELIRLRGEEEQKVVDVARVKQVADAKQLISERARNLYPDTGLASAVAEVASQFCTVTLAPDEAQTLERQQQAADKIEPATRIVPQNGLIIGAGVEWTDQAVQTIEDYRTALSEAKGMERRVKASVGHTIILLLLMLGMARALAIIAPQVYSSLRHVTVALLAVTVMVGVAKVLSLLNYSGYLAPVAAAPILLAILMDKRVGLLAGAVLAVLVSMVYGNSWSVLAIVVSGSLAGVLGVVSVRKRSDLVRPGLLVGIVTIAVTVALGFIGDTMRWSAEGLEPVRDAAINGLLVMMLVPGTLSLFESAFRITTDIHLLELTDLNHPILRRMMMEAPGTHHHNLMVGNLAEVAAEAIGANSLMARVCSYYHDIGKLNRPEYFSENQTDHNRHDGLSPTMSSRIIARHVKDGVELAREYGLCEPVVDIIEQHHGTDLIRFFYEKALQSDKHDNGVREEDFRYPGPKPQSREAAVVMVADCIESASRSLTNLTPARLRAVADKIISTRFADGQFDNCDLTLRDLHVIAESVLRLLTSAHHKRVEYPEQESPELVRTSRFLSGG